MTYDLSPYISQEDICIVRGVIYGSNDVGDSSTQVELQAPGGKVNNYCVCVFSHVTKTSFSLFPPQTAILILVK